MVSDSDIVVYIFKKDVYLIRFIVVFMGECKKIAKISKKSHFFSSILLTF